METQKDNRKKQGERSGPRGREPTTKETEENYQIKRRLKHNESMNIFTAEIHFFNTEKKESHIKGVLKLNRSPRGIHNVYIKKK